MTAAGRPPRERRTSTLANDVFQPVPAKPPANPAPPTVPPAAEASADPEAATRADARARGRARDEAEARARRDARSAAYGWATAVQRSRARAEALDTQVAASIEHGTDIDVLAGFVREACARNDIPLGYLPADLRARLGITGL